RRARAAVERRDRIAERLVAFRLQAGGQRVQRDLRAAQRAPLLAVLRERGPGEQLVRAPEVAAPGGAHRLGGQQRFRAGRRGRGPLVVERFVEALERRVVAALDLDRVRRDEPEE